MATFGTDTVYVIDTFNQRVQRFDDLGVFELEWGSVGFGDGLFGLPEFITTDANGDVYVTDRSGNVVQKFDGEGTFLTKWGTVGTGNGQFNSMSGVAVDPEGNVFIVDKLNHRVQKFGVVIVDVTQGPSQNRVFELSPGYPNPMVGQTRIEFQIPTMSKMSLRVFDARGRLVRDAISETMMSAGRHIWIWDGLDSNGSRVRPGTYFFQLITPEGTQTVKSVVLR